MSDENNLFTPERAAELERRIAAFNRQMSFSVVKSAGKTPAISRGETAPAITAEQPKPLGW